MAGVEDSREHGSFRPPAASWGDVLPSVAPRLHQLRRSLDALLAAEADFSSVPSPAELAFELGAAAADLSAALAPEEHDLRQVIATLRTGLALCLDMYGVREAERTSVRGYMERLRSEIATFETELDRVRREDPPRAE